MPLKTQKPFEKDFFGCHVGHGRQFFLLYAQLGGNMGRILKFLVCGSFAIYSMVVIYIVFFWHRRGIWSNMSMIQYALFQMNLVPFKTISGYVKAIFDGSMNLSIPIKNLGGNLFMFFPLGIYLPLFVEKMNTREKELGMNDTTFKNCHGIDEDGHVTSAYDIALMSRELLNNHPSITEYTTIWMDSIRNGESELVNTNKLIRNYKGATGLKTGSTSIALYNLSASATRDGLSLIAVIMKAPTTKIRFNEATKLLDYGFANYTSKSFGNKGDFVQTVNVNKGLKPQVNAVLQEDASVLIKKGDTGNITQNVVINENISAPIKQGDVLGKIEYKAEDKVILEKNLVAEKDIDKSTMWNITTNLYLKWFNMCR